MPHIEIIPEDDIGNELKPIYEAAKQRAGGVAHIIQLQSRDPKVAAASLGFYIQLMKSPNGLSNARKELLATVVSHVNDCFY